jgi:hypothetical protein
MKYMRQMDFIHIEENISILMEGLNNLLNIIHMETSMRSLID